MSKFKPDLSKLSPQTKLVAAGRDYAEHGFVNPAVYHGSTVMFPTAQALHDRSQTYVYGRRGTPTSRAVEEAVALVEGGHNAKMTPSGMAAISTALLAFLKSGDHLLMVDTVYHPARLFCDGLLKGLGIETTYYDPLIGRGIAALIRPNTRVVYTESPGSQTMEVQDIPAIAEAAHKAGAIVMIDNTWGAGHFFKAFEHGADISIQAATKYLVGHSDAMMGTITCNAETWPRFKDAYEEMGMFAGPDDMYLTLRGIHTLDVRLERHMKNAIAVAEWLRAARRGRDGALPGTLQCAGPRYLEARLQGRVRSVLHRAETVQDRSGRCLPRPAVAVRHGLQLGRLRKPCRAVQAPSHRHHMDGARPLRPLSYRA